MHAFFCCGGCTKIKTRCDQACGWGVVRRDCSSIKAYGVQDRWIIRHLTTRIPHEKSDRACCATFLHLISRLTLLSSTTAFFFCLFVFLFICSFLFFSSSFLCSFFCFFFLLLLFNFIRPLFHLSLYHPPPHSPSIKTDHSFSPSRHTRRSNFLSPYPAIARLQPITTTISFSSPYCTFFPRKQGIGLTHNLPFFPTFVNLGGCFVIILFTLFINLYYYFFCLPLQE